MTLRSSDLQSDSDLDSIRNSCDVFFLQFFCFSDTAFAVTLVEHDFVFGTLAIRRVAQTICITSLVVQTSWPLPPSSTTTPARKAWKASSPLTQSTPHPATPGLLGGYVIKSGVFLTRMDPNNSKAAIAFNNYR